MRGKWRKLGSGCTLVAVLPGFILTFWWIIPLLWLSTWLELREKDRASTACVIVSMLPGALLTVWWLAPWLYLATCFDRAGGKMYDDDGLAGVR